MEKQGRQVEAIRRQGDQKTTIQGLKGTDVICALPYIDIATCFVPEYMHSVLLGVVRQMIALWFTKAGPWNIRKNSKDVDEFLLRTKPLNCFNRMPRRITVFQSWKASEFYNWCLFYSLPVLVQYLPHKYLEHFILLVKALYILLLKRIKETDLECPDKLLKLFVKQFKFLYSDRDMSYNVHQLLHLVLSVRRWGPLWATSAFVFENQNGFLGNSVHGTKNLGQEMVNNLLIVQGLQVLKNRANEANVATVKQRKATHVIGKCSTVNLRPMEQNLLISEGLEIDSITVYARSKINDIDYTSQIYKSIKTNNYTVQVDYFDDATTYGTIRFFYMDHLQLCFVLNVFAIEHCRIFSHDSLRESVDHILPVQETDNYVVIKMDSVKSISQLIRVGDFICKRPNLLNKIL